MLKLMILAMTAAAAAATASAVAGKALTDQKGQAETEKTAVQPAAVGAEPTFRKYHMDYMYV